MTTLPATERIRIEAPSGDAALRLERRLAHLAPTSVSVDDEWWVEIPDLEPDRVDEVVAAVRRWLAHESIEETLVHHDGFERRIVRGGVR